MQNNKSSTFFSRSIDSSEKNNDVNPRSKLRGFEKVLDKGMTLIELLLVVAIVLSLSALSTPFYSRFLTQNEVENTSDQLVGSIRKAQIYAMMGKKSSNWGVNYSANMLTLYKGNSYISRETVFDEKFSVNANISISFSSPLTDINFTRMTGLPSIQPEITITDNNKSEIFNINSQGVISK